MSNLTEEKIELVDPAPALQQVDAPVDVPVDAPEPTTEEPTESPELLVEPSEPVSLEQQDKNIQLAQERLARKEARSPKAEPVDDQLSQLTDPAVDFFVEFAEQRAKEQQRIQEIGVVPAVVEAHMSRQLYVREGQAALALNFDELDRDPNGGMILYDRLLKHPNPEIDNLQLEVINGIQLKDGSSVKPLGFITTRNPDGTAIPGAVKKDNSIDLSKVNLVTTLKDMQGNVIPFSEASFDLKMKKLGRFDGFVVYETDINDDNKYLFTSNNRLYTNQSERPPNKAVRIFGLNNNNKHADLLGRMESVRPIKNEGQDSFLDKFIRTFNPDPVIEKIKSGEVTDTEGFIIKREFVDSAVKYDSLMARAGVGKNQRIIALEAHRDGTREQTTGPLNSVFRFFTEMIPNIGISIYNTYDPRIGSTAGEAATLNPYRFEGATEGRNSDVLEQRVNYPTMLIGGQLYVDMLRDPELKVKLSDEDFQAFVPEGYEIQPDGTIDKKYVEGAAQKYAEFTGISEDAALEIMSFTTGFVEPIKKDLIYAVPAAGLFRAGGALMAKSRYNNDFLPFMLGKLNLKDEAAYIKFLRGGDKGTNAQENRAKAFELTQEYMTGTRFLGTRVRPQEELRSGAEGQLPITSVIKKAGQGLSNIPRRMSNFWRGLQNDAVSGQLERGARLTPAGKAAAKTARLRNLARLKKNADKHFDDATKLAAEGNAAGAAVARSKYRRASLTALYEGFLQGQRLLRDPRDRIYFKEEGKALLAYGFGQMVLNDYLPGTRGETQHSFLAELGTTVGAYLLLGPVEATTKLAAYSAAQFATIKRIEFMYGKMIDGETVEEALGGFGIDKKAAKTAADNFFRGLAPEEVDAFNNELLSVRTMYDDILSLQEELDVDIFPEEMDVPATLGQLLGNGQMMALGQAFRAERHVTDIKNLPSVLRAEKTVAQQQVEFNQNLLALAEAALKYSDDLEPKTVELLEAMRATAQINSLQYKTQLDDLNLEIDNIESNILTLVREGTNTNVDIDDGMNTINMFDAIEEIEGNTSVFDNNGEVTGRSLQDFRDRIQEAATAKQQHTTNFLEAAKNPANGITNNNIDTEVGNQIRGSYETQKKIMDEEYAALELSTKEVDSTTGEPTLTTFVDLSGTFKNIQNRVPDAQGLDVEVMLDDVDSNLATIISNLNADIPLGRRAFAIADAAAERHFKNSHDLAGATPAQYVAGIYERMPENLQKKYPLRKTDTGNISPRSIDAWDWMDNLDRNITQDEFNKLKEANPEFFNTVYDDIVDVGDLRQIDAEGNVIRSNMDLPFTMMEYWNLRKALNKSATAGKENNKRIARTMRDELDNVEFVRGYYNEDGGIVDTEFQTELKRVNKSAKDNFYDRFDPRATPQSRRINRSTKPGNDANILDEILKPLNKITGDINDPENILRLDETVVSNLAKIFGGVKDPDTGLYVFVDNEGADNAARALISWANRQYLTSDAGQFIVTAAKNGKVPLGLVADLDGVRRMDEVSKAATSQQRNLPVNQFVNQIRTLGNIKVFSTKTDADGNIIVDKNAPAERLFRSESDIIDFSEINNIEQIKEYGTLIQKFEKDFTIAVKNKKGVELEQRYQNEQDIYKIMFNFAEGTLTKAATGPRSDAVSEVILGPDGIRIIDQTRAKFIDRKINPTEEDIKAGRSAMSQEKAAEEFDSIITDTLAKAVFKRIKVSNTPTGEAEIDLAELYRLLQDEDFGRVARSQGKAGEKVIESMQTIYDFGARVTGRDPEKFALSGRPLRVLPESFINKAWQVTRNTVSFRFLALEAIYRTGRRASFEHIQFLLTDPKVANAFVKLARDGYVASSEDFDIVYEATFAAAATHYGKQFHYGKNESDSKFASRANTGRVLDTGDMFFRQENVKDFRDYTQKRGAIQ